MAPTGDGSVPVRSNGEFAEFALFQAVTMCHGHAANFIGDLHLLKETVFRERDANGKFTVTAGGDIAIAGGEHDVWMQAVVDRGTHQELLPIGQNIGAAPLAFQVESPFGFANGMVAKVVPPPIGVVSVNPPGDRLGIGYVENC